MTDQTDTISTVGELAKSYTCTLITLMEDGFNKDDIAEVVGQDVYDATKERNYQAVAALALGYEILKAS